jgi:ABC-type sugar transport system substrate-binding protein
MANVGAWRLAETNSLRGEVRRRGSEYELVVTDAQDSTAKQISDVEDLVARRTDALLIAPREYEGLEPAFEAAARARIPVVLIDRQAAGQPGRDYVTFLGSDFVAQGRRAAEWLVSHRGGKVAVVELTGTPGSSVARDRARGFREGIAGQVGVRLLGSQPADFSRATALRVTENVLQGLGREITAIYAHNDEMALGAIQALRGAGRRPGVDVTLVSIDGQRLALEAILRGELGASIESNPRFGPLAFATLDRLRAGKPVPPKIILEDRLFDSSNAARFVSQAY